jgi:membrane protease YdiL (CAAX protease family)
MAEEKSHKDQSNPSKTFQLCLLFWILFLVLLFTGGIYLVKIFPLTWERFTYGFTATIAACLSIWAMIKVDRKSLAEIGLVWQSGTLARFFKGLLIGSVLMGILLCLIMLLTGIRLQWNPEGFSFNNALFYLSVFPLLFAEELVFRSYPFVKLNQSYPLIITQIIVSIAFALYHIVIGWNVYAALLGPGIWAFVFGLAAFRSGGIAMPIGIHLALNVWQPLLGFSTGTYTSLWILKSSDNPVIDQQRSDLIGLIFQIALLVTAVVLTIRHSRRSVTPTVSDKY